VPPTIAFKLHTEDRLAHIETALREALVSLPGLQINAHEVGFVPVLKPDVFHGMITRINIDFWERRERTKEGPQELTARFAKAFQRAAGTDRQGKRDETAVRRRENALGFGLIARPPPLCPPGLVCPNRTRGSCDSGSFTSSPWKTLTS